MSVWDGGDGGEGGTFSRLSEHPTAAAAAVSQTRRRGHPPSGGKKKEQKIAEGKESERGKKPSETNQRKQEERPSADQMGVGEGATSC